MALSFSLVRLFFFSLSLSPFVHNIYSKLLTRRWRRTAVSCVRVYIYTFPCPHNGVINHLVWRAARLLVQRVCVRVCVYISASALRAGNLVIEYIYKHLPVSILYNWKGQLFSLSLLLVKKKACMLEIWSLYRYKFLLFFFFLRIEWRSGCKSDGSTGYENDAKLKETCFIWLGG